MGLILSVLVACVGIAKFFEIYGDLTKRLELHPKNDVKPNKISNGDDLNQAKLPRIQLSRDVLSHEDIELECPTDLINRRSNSPRRFLITEKESHRSPSPARRFVVSEDVNDNSDVREFLVTQGVPKESPDTKRFILLDTKDNYRSNSPLPLPKQFIITEGDTQLTNKTLKSATEGIRIDVSSQSIENQNTESAVLPLSEVLFKTFVENLEHTLQAKNYANQAESNSLEPEYEEFHRSSSPYPDLGVKIRKSSTDLLENPMVSVEETDEDDYSDNSKSDTKIDVILHNKNYNTTEYWTNKIMVMPPKLLKKFGGEGSSLSKSSCDLANGCLKKSIRKTKTLDDLQKDSFDGLKLSIDGRKVIKRKKRGRSFNLDDRHFNTSGYKRLSSPTQKSPEDTDSSLIFSGEYTTAMNKDWHGQHFCCWQCDESLTGQRYVLRDDHPYCVSCYESVFANACEKCSRMIGIDSKDLSYKDKHWHEACFLCTTCGESLVDRQFGSKGDRIYCGRCYDNQFASKCDGCNQIFRAGTKKMEYKTRQWHEKCFCCCVCKVPIGTQSFIPREQEIYCAKCYEEKFATRCVKCNKVITTGGVTYKNEPWHRECFTCTNCNKSLAGERFTSRDDKPFCAECFGELFAKRCFACNKPITGIGGTKFISFEDRHWHNDCFFCAACQISLVGKGFITDNEDIICPDCAKQKML